LRHNKLKKYRNTKQFFLMLQVMLRVARFFLCAWYQNRKKCTKLTQNVLNGHKISQMSIKYSKWPQTISTFSNLRPSQIYPNRDFWFENKPSGNPCYAELYLSRLVWQWWVWIKTRFQTRIFCSQSCLILKAVCSQSRWIINQDWNLHLKEAPETISS
jgi:hypothetical protein